MPTAAQLSENSHQGFDGIKAALCLVSTKAKSNTASGMPVCLWREGIGSRSSGKERDAETGLDFFLARYYSGPQGRFLSVDPENAGASKDDPQSWNAYSYALNNPLRYVDPTGMTSVSINDLIGMGWTDQEAFNFVDSLPMMGSGYNITLFKYERSQAIFAQEMYSAYLEGLKPKVEVNVTYPDPGTLASGRIEDASFEFWSTMSVAKGFASMGGRLFRSIFKVAASTGRTEALNLTEQLAMQQAKSNPLAGTVVRLKRGMQDVRWPGSEGWVKMRQHINGVEIHYLRNTITRAVADFKFID